MIVKNKTKKKHIIQTDDISQGSSVYLITEKGSLKEKGREPLVQMLTFNLRYLVACFG